MKLEEKYIEYVKASLDISVGSTGYPITAQVLTRAGLADRKKLRLLEKHGHIHSVMITIAKGKGAQTFKAYYTQNELPEKFMKDYRYIVNGAGDLVQDAATTSEVVPEPPM